jgi:hypothetical protein
MTVTSIPTDLKETHRTVQRYFFHKVPVSEMNLEAFIAESVNGFGTTKDELVLNLENTRELLYE